MLLDPIDRDLCRFLVKEGKKGGFACNQQVISFYIGKASLDRTAGNDLQAVVYKIKASVSFGNQIPIPKKIAVSNGSPYSPRTALSIYRSMV